MGLPGPFRLLLQFTHQFALNLPTRYLLGIFKKYPLRYPTWTHRAQAGYFLKVPTAKPSGQVTSKTLEFFHRSHQKVPSGYFVKEPLGFFHNSHHNVPIKELEPLIQSSLRVLSKSTQSCDHNVPSGFFSKNSQRTHNVAQFHHKLSKNSV